MGTVNHSKLPRFVTEKSNHYDRKSILYYYVHIIYRLNIVHFIFHLKHSIIMLLKYIFTT